MTEHGSLGSTAILTGEGGAHVPPRTIPDLQAKLRALMKSEISQAVGKYNGSAKSFGEATIGRESLIFILQKKIGATLNSHHERKIAERCKFGIDWPEWQTDTAAAFIARYERMHRQNAAERRIDVQLARGPDIEPEGSHIEGLLGVEVFPAQYGRGQVDLGFELSSGQLKATHGLRVSIRSGTLALRCFPGNLLRSTRKGFDQPWQCTSSRGTVTFEWAPGSTFDAKWRLSTSGVSLGNLDVPPDFVTVEKLAPGDEIEMSFGFRVKDFGIAEDSEAVQFEDGTATGDDVSVEQPANQSAMIDPRQLSETKKRILARLRTAALVDDGDGYVVHARHRVSFIEQEDADGKRNGR